MYILKINTPEVLGLFTTINQASLAAKDYYEQSVKEGSMTYEIVRVEPGCMQSDVVSVGEIHM
jgi:hypothetical protein